MRIPEGFIEDADVYTVALGSDVTKVKEIGGRVMMNLLVREQMDPFRIIATTGVEPNADWDTTQQKPETRCLIIVDYTEEEFMRMYNRAKGEVDRLVRLGEEVK